MMPATAALFNIRLVLAVYACACYLGKVNIKL